MRLSSDKITPTRKPKGSVGALIAQIAFKDLEKKTAEIMGQPILCGGCGAALVNIASIQEDNKIGKFFRCEFCDEINKITLKLDLPADNELEFIEEVDKKLLHDGTEDIIACIDISGSMKGTKIEAVKQSLIQTIKELARDDFPPKFGLITFTHDIRLYNPQGEIALTISEDPLHNEEEIRKLVNQADFSFVDLKTTETQWIDVVNRLKALNSTALGPAVVAAEELLRHHGGRIILLTDGMANAGVGRLSGYSRTGKQFYSNLGKKAQTNGTSIELVGVSAGDHNAKISLESLGELAHLTEGDIFYVDITEVGSVFDALAESDIIGRRVSVRIYLPQGIELEGVTGGVSYDYQPKTNSVRINLSSVNPDRSFCLQFNPHTNLAKSGRIPIQSQIEYMDMEGRKRTRIYSSNIAITPKEEDVLRSYNSSISTAYNIQEANDLRVKPQEGLKFMRSYQTELKKVQDSIKDVDFKDSLSAVETEINDLEEQVQVEQQSFDAYYSLASSKLRYMRRANIRMEDRAKRKKDKK
jgi:hypothetical protein